MAPSGLPVLKRVFDVLASTPDKLRREIEAMSPRELSAVPAPGKWSVQIVLAHLDDLESFAMRGRVEAMVTQDNPFLKSFDQVARTIELHYDRKDPEKSLEVISKPCTKDQIYDSYFPVEGNRETEQRQREGRWRDTVDY
jgi:hypothetical protein